MPKLNDTQSILLSSAAQRENGSLYPLSQKLTSGARLTAAITRLLGLGFVEERETIAASEIHRTEGDTRFGLYATASGLAAVGIGDSTLSADETEPQSTTEVAPTRVSKSTAVIELLSRDGGATLPELIAATSWLPHTTRAALTGLRKKGHLIEKAKRDGDTCYRIIGAA